MRWMAPCALVTVIGLACPTALAASPAEGDSWPQFRGRNAAGVALASDPLPAQIGPETNVLWKTPLPPGHSSPVVHGDRIYVTAVRGEQLLTIALDRATGRVLWEDEAPHETLEAIHRIGSHAQPSPATDGQLVVSFFGSSGLSCYDREGKLIWRRRMGPFNNEFGAGTSPILVDDWIVLCQDHDTGSFLMALDKRTGETVWKTDRSEFPRNYCTPILWEADGSRQIVVAATLRVAGYDLATGQELWTVWGLSRAVCVTPVVGDDGTLFVAGWSAGGDANERIALDPIDTFFPSNDADGNGTLEEPEVPDGPVKPRFLQVDRDKSGSITRAEYDYYRGLFDQARNVVLAIKPGGRGDVTETHVAWEYDRYVPFCASPLFYAGHLFTIKDGGILNCLEAGTGEPARQERIAATGEYYSSPVGGDEKIYLANSKGELTVISGRGDWEVLSTAEFGEDVYATPAIAGGWIYFRTAGHLYCFGLPDEAATGE
jgi:outer membrane protein assembly factor BamB